ncbi:TrlF family AAA-like ATPase [uncultured Erythrobacter sp.]|uniref:TrlF family AAA-like ATPase n=1 Tax=uncultured Erythrobacter sp. TaxID=263913 RepID=UPI0026169A4D|nr:AAA family ATPase [uncultured Erythrobacter sp.]
MSFAHWRKCDFQVHTPRDPGWKGARPVGLGEEYQGRIATSEDVDRDREKWAYEFVDWCIKRGLEAVALTDHHEMVMFPYVAAEAAKRHEADESFGLWFFPGMELTCRGGVQCIIIFDADLAAEWRTTAQARLGIVAASLNESARQGPAVTQLDYDYPDIASRLEPVEELRGRFIVLPNVSDGGAHTVVTQGAHANFKAMPYVGGYVDCGQSIDTIPHKLRVRLSGEDPYWGDRYIYPLPTSDARSADYSKLGNNSCWIKLAEPTAEAIRQAFLGHPSRILITPPVTPSIAVQSLSVSGSSILSDQELRFSPEFNSIIGGRGSGKSTVLEYLAYGLGRSCSDISKGSYSGSDRLKGVIADTLVASGATIEIGIEQDRANFYVRRGAETGHVATVTYPDGTKHEMSVAELRALFPAVVYSQGELSELGKIAGSRAQLSQLLQFVDPEFKRKDRRLSNEIEQSKLAIRRAIQALVNGWLQEEKVRKLNAARATLEQRIAALQKSLPTLSKEEQAHIVRYEALAELDGKRQAAEAQAQTVLDEFTGLWQTSRSPVDLLSTAPEAADFQAAYEEFRKVFSRGVEALGKDLEARRVGMATKGAEIGRTLIDAKSERDRVMEELTEHKVQTTQIAKLQEELQALVGHIASLESRQVSVSEKQGEFNAAIDNLKALVEEGAKTTERWVGAIEMLSGNCIDAEFVAAGDHSEVHASIDALVAQTGSQEATRKHRVVEQLADSGVWPFLDTIRAECLSLLRWKTLSPEGGGGAPAFPTIENAIGGTENMKTRLKELIDLQRVEAIATATPKPDVSLYYVDGGNRYAFEKASEGQRAAALLLMLLEQAGGPLLVDQPEGDLDNKVVSDLAEKLHSAKQHRQVIFASHNANIVVNGSSELVVSMEITQDAKRSASGPGAIDRQDIRLKITETMEGGEKAFKDRKNKYGY